jgi:HTH-type transcriptional regulator/antitoxin HipB
MLAEPRRRARKHSGELAETFVARRHQLRMTQAELALLAGVGRSTVQSLEGRKNPVRLDSVFADALGCDIALLMRAGSSPRPELTVSRIPQSGHDDAPIVELIVDGGTHHADGMF